MIGWLLRKTNRLRASAAERRAKAEAKVLRRRIRDLEGQLAKAQAEAAAREAEVEAFQEAHARTVAMLQAEAAQAHARTAKAEKGKTLI